MSPQTQAAGSAGIGIIGSFFAGKGEEAAGKQEKAAYDYNADVAILNANNEMVSSEQRYSALVGKQATAYAASGVDITKGSPLLMMAATAGRGGRQAAEIYQAGQQEATLDRYYGKIAAWRGRVAGIGTFLGGISKGVLSYLSATGYQGGSSSGDNVDWSKIDAGIDGN